jgi:endonuclease/exonuclease/phosphatase family metal-dependent hydrolase
VSSPQTNSIRDRSRDLFARWRRHPQRRLHVSVAIIAGVVSLILVAAVVNGVGRSEVARFPKTPTGISVTTHVNAIDVHWKHWRGATGYKVSVATDEGFSHVVKTKYVSKKKRVVRMGHLEQGSGYYYRVVAQNTVAFVNGRTSIGFVRTAFAAVTAPVNVVVSPISATRALVTWDKASYASTYTVSVRNAAGKTSTFKAGTDTSYRLTNLPAASDAGSSYVVSVTATNGGGSTATSGEVTSYALPSKVQGTTVIGTSSGGFTVRWNDAINAAQYVIDVSSTKDFAAGTTTSHTVDAVSNHFTVNGLAADTAYYARVHAIDQTASGPVSAAVTATTDTAGTPLTVGNYNVFGASYDLDVTSWAARRQAVADMIDSGDYDLLGLQEGDPHHRASLGGQSQVQQIEEDAATAGLTMSEEQYGTNQILFNANVLTAGAHGHVSFVATDTSNPRSYIWQYFTVKATNQKILFVSTHLASDTGGVHGSIRVEEAKQLAADVAVLAKGGVPTMIVGDLNGDYSSTGDGPINTLEDAGWVDGHTSAATDPDPTVNSWHGFYLPRPETSNDFDHVLTTPDIAQNDFSVLTNASDGTDVYAARGSDHFPTRLTITLPPQ